MKRSRRGERVVGGSQPRVMMIGLDCADAGLLDRWCREGYLPTLQSLRETGTWAQLGTTADTLHVSGWPSLYTGTTPDKHGLCHAYVMKSGHQLPQRPLPNESGEPFFWKALSDAGKRCVIMDAFMSCPVEPFNGTQVLEYGTWTWFWHPMTTPPELHREILDRFGAYPAEDHSKVLTPPDPAGFRDRLVRGAGQKAEVVRWLMQRDTWDFFFVIFGESHPAGHYLWHLHDPSYVAHPVGGAGSLSTALRDVYVAIDQAIGEIVSQLDDSTTVMIVSADGMGPNYSGSYVLEEMLTRLGLFAQAGSNGTGASSGPATAAKRSVAKRARDMVPGPLRVAVSRYFLPHDLKHRLAIRWMTADILWSGTRAFPISNANEGYIRINVRGREPDGIVAPGAEYEELCAALVEILRGLRNPRNGRPAARTVSRVDEIYRGACRDRLPDVIVTWDPGAEVTTELFAERTGVVRVDKPRFALIPYYTGNHQPAAFLIANGPGVPAGKAVDGAHILDIAPTVLTHFGLDPLTPMDGVVRTELMPAPAGR